MARIPLYGRGNTIRAWALVDDADVALVSAYRWHLDKGYARSWNGGNEIAMHRLILGLTKGDRREGDHISRNRRDNRRANLRVATRAQNRQNLGIRPTSRARGVCRDPRGGWRARVVVGGREHARRLPSRRAAERAVRDLRAALHPFSAEAAA